MHITKSHAIRAAVLIIFGTLATAFADDHIETANVTLYQPDSVLAERNLAPKDLAAYIQTLTKIVEAEIGADAEKEALDVVVVVRPGKRVKVWFVSSLASPPSRKLLTEKLEGVVPVEVNGGPLAFAISLNIAGATRKGDFEPPMPSEWIAAVKGKEAVIIPEGIIDAIWDETTNPTKPEVEQDGI